MHRRCRPLIFLALALCAAALASCAGLPPPSAPDKQVQPTQLPALTDRETPERRPSAELRLGKTVSLALLLPLSGQNADIGETLLNAAQMALFRLDDPQLVLRPYDTRGTPQGAQRAVQTAIDDDVSIILGPLFGASVAAAGPVAREQRIPMIAFSNDRSVAGNGVFLLSFIPDEQVYRIIGFSAAQNIERLAALIPQTAYGQNVLTAMQQAAQWNGAEIMTIEFYPPNAAALFDPVRRLARYEQRQRNLAAERASLEALGEDDDLAQETLKRLEPLDALGPLNYEAVLVPEGGALLRTLAPILPYFEIDPKRVRFLGTGLWDVPSLNKEPALIGGWFAGPDPAPVRALFEEYEALYGESPARIATLAYDAVLLSATVIYSPQGQINPYGFLNSGDGFTGIDGLFRFRPDGTSERGLAVIEITEDGMEIIDPPPSSFRYFDPQRRGARQGPHSGPDATDVLSEETDLIF